MLLKKKIHYTFKILSRFEENILNEVLLFTSKTILKLFIGDLNFLNLYFMHRILIKRNYGQLSNLYQFCKPSGFFEMIAIEKKSVSYFKFLF